MLRERDLRSYQNRTIDWLYARDCGIAVLDLGAGKTVSALTAASELIQDGVIRHALIVAPKRVAELVWPAELKGWEHLAGLKAAILAGGPSVRQAVLDYVPTRQITIIGIDNVQWLVNAIERLPRDHPIWDCLIIDETSKLKSPSSKRARALLRLADRFKVRWGLTGTPRPNGEHDLFMPATVISAGKLWGRSFDRWRRERMMQIDHMGYDWKIRPDWVDRTNTEFASMAITLDEGDMPDLPELNVVLEPVEFTPDLRQAYETAEQDLIGELMLERGMTAETAGAVATGILAQFVAGFRYGENNTEVTFIHELKLEWLDELVESLDGSPLLIAYEFVEDARRLTKRYGCPVLGGGTPSAEAATAIEAWNSGTLPILGIHPASAGHGLNLQRGGHHLAWLGLTWSAEQYEQTIKRIHRPGQKNHVTIHVPLIRGTVDVMKRKRVLEKMTAQQALREYLAKI